MRDRLVCGTTRAVQLDSSSARKVRSLNCRGPWETTGRGGGAAVLMRTTRVQTCMEMTVILLMCI